MVKVATFEMKDKNDVIAYRINQSTTTQPNYTTIAATTRATSSYTAEAAGTYVIWVKDVSGKVATASFTISQNLFCAFNPNQIWKFDYTGDVQSFTVPCSGTYKLEVWDAQRGYDKVGSESQGTLVTVYGGKGGDCEWTSASSGGYNGGGSNADKENEGGGGGSGYIGGVTNGSMQNGKCEGNGYAKITLISIN